MVLEACSNAGLRRGTCKRKYDAYGDPGHAWMKVQRSELQSLGIADKITGYSHQRGDMVFLEEDADLSTFAKALEAKYGRSFEELVNIRDHHTDKQSKIRGYEPYRR
jgi:hypothetical protein